MTEEQQRIRRANRRLDTQDLIDKIKAEAPAEILDNSKIVGSWVWVSFPEKPAPHVTLWLKLAGFNWNNERHCWQHNCGHWTKSAPYDPRAKYGESQINGSAKVEIEDKPAPKPTQSAGQFHFGGAINNPSYAYDTGFKSRKAANG